MHIKKNDDVVMIAGKDRGKKGKVLAAFPKSDTVLVEQINVMKHHKKRRGYRQLQQTGIMELEVPVHISNVMLVCPRCNRQARISEKKLESGFRVRVCRKCKEVVDSK
jgi:large subunit ribosomal protein L24